jgi:hypothetical protein
MNGTGIFFGVCFTDANNGTVVGSRGTILRTSDGGTNWIQQSSGTGSNLKSVSFTNADYGIAVGDSGTILRTTNGGTNWTQQSIGTTNFLFSVSFTDVNNGTVVGEYGTILRTTDGGTTFVEEERLDGITNNFFLCDNFPNPFNPSTIMKYSIPRTSIVIIKVFDILGNEIETLINEEKSAGTYEAKWNGSNLPSGVYFYQMRAGDFVQTKKMMLIK